MIMLRIQSLVRTVALAMPLLLLAQCMPQASPPNALLGAQKTPPACFDNPDPMRTFEIVSPLAGPVCSGQCTHVLVDVQNPCGQWTTSVEGWYDGVYRYVGFVEMGSAVHWDTPFGPHGLAPARHEVRLRVTVTDELGVIGTRDVVLGPVYTLYTPDEHPRRDQSQRD
jgi:hypothetical protein